MGIDLPIRAAGHDAPKLSRARSRAAAGERHTRELSAGRNGTFSLRRREDERRSLLQAG
jgi:hypothetical protein